MKKTALLLCLFLVLWVASCAVNPVTGRRELSLISEAQEISLGQETDKQIRAQYGVYADPELNQYVEGVGKTLVPHTHRPQLTYHFAVLDSPVVNAFAVPGGYIYVTRGILAMMNSEAELAVVLSHELGHVNARHSVRRLSKLLLVQLGLSVGGALSETFAKLTGVASVGIQLLFLKYSRDDEREADFLGVQYSRSGGFNPGEMVNFFTSLQRLGDLSKGASLPGFLSTHPLTKERIQNVGELLQASDRQLIVRKHSYLDNINNIVFGEDPRQGYVEKNAFYHPLLRFSFSIPDDWTVQNTPSQVVLSSKDGNAALVLQAEKSSEQLSAYAQKKLSDVEGKQYLSDQYITINSLSAYQQLFDIDQEEKEDLRLRLTCIKKGEYIYSWSSLSTTSDFSKYDYQFQSVERSFKNLTNRAYINREPKRIRLIRANGRDSLRQIFKKAGMAEDLWTKFAIINDIKLDETPAEARPIKIVR